MKLLKLADSVYWVAGAQKSCIYDLVQDRLYWTSLGLYETVASLDRNTEKFDQAIKTVVSAGILCDKNSVIFEDLDGIPYSCDVLLLEVTQRCNMSCDFCYAPNSSNDMDLEVLKRCWKKFSDLNPKSIRIVGGEPLLRINFLKYLIVFLRSTFSGTITVYTNGILLSDEVACFFAENGVDVSIAIKPNKEAFAEKALEICQKNNLEVKTFFLKEAGAKSPNGISPTRTDLVRLSGKASLNLYDFQLFNEKAISIESFQRIGLTKHFRLATKMHPCFGKKILVDPEFNVFPCPMERIAKIGQMEEENIIEKIVNYGRGFTKDVVKSCSCCEFRYACHDCRADRLGNELYEKPWYCLYIPEKGFWENAEEKFKRLQNTR